MNTRWTVSTPDTGNTVEKVCRTCRTVFGPEARHCPTHQGYLLLHSLVGDTLRDRYLVEEQIGGNAHSLVFRARDLELNTSVAVKALLLDADGYRYPRDRIIREAETYITLSDPRFPRVFARGELDDGRPYYVYEHVNGPTLGQVIEADGPLAGERAVRIAAQIAAALAEAHEHKFVHQNLHPHAIMIYRDQAGLDIVKIIDFGMVGHARVGSDAASSQTALRPLGINGYVSPEQWDGQSVDERTDVYSLGVMLYEMVTAMLPFAENDKNRLKELVCNCAPPRPTERNPNVTVPRRLEDVIIQLIATERDRRPSRMVDVCMMLEEALESRDGLQQAEVVDALGFSREFGPFDTYVPPVPPRDDVAEAMLIAGPHDELLPPAPGLRFTPPPQPVEEAELVDEPNSTQNSDFRQKARGLERFGPFDEPSSSVFALDASGVDFADDDEPGFDDYIDDPPKPATPADAAKLQTAARVAAGILSDDIFDSKPKHAYRIGAEFGVGADANGVTHNGVHQSGVHWGAQPDIDSEVMRQGSWNSTPAPGSSFSITTPSNATPIPGRAHPTVLQREEQSYQAMLEDSNPSAPRPLPRKKSDPKGVSMPFVVSVVILSGLCGIVIVLALWQLPSSTRSQSAPSPVTRQITEKVPLESPVISASRQAFPSKTANDGDLSSSGSKRSVRRSAEPTVSQAASVAVDTAISGNNPATPANGAPGTPDLATTDNGAVVADGALEIPIKITTPIAVPDTAEGTQQASKSESTLVTPTPPSPTDVTTGAATVEQPRPNGNTVGRVPGDTVRNSTKSGATSKIATKTEKPKQTADIAVANPAVTKPISSTSKPMGRDSGKPNRSNQAVEQSDFKTF